MPARQLTSSAPTASLFLTQLTAAAPAKDLHPARGMLQATHSAAAPLLLPLHLLLPLELRLRILVTLHL